MMTGTLLRGPLMAVGRLTLIAVIFAAGLGIGLGLSVGRANSGGDTVSACVNNSTGAMRYSTRCRSYETPLSWTQHGIRDYESRTSAVTVSPSVRHTGTVPCTTPGKRVLGGGVVVISGDFEILSSGPSSSGDGWEVDILETTGTTGGQFRVSFVCASVV